MNSRKNWALRVDSSVHKDIKSFPRKDAERIFFVIENLSFDPFTGDIQKLENEDNVWRRRIGNYRIFYEILKDEKVIHVFRTERRTTKTYKKRK